MRLIQGDIFINAVRCHDLLMKANEVFGDYLRKKFPPKAPEYYQARNFLREGQALYEDILKKAKQLLGPIPPYAAPDYEEKRIQVLDENKVIVRGMSVEAVKEEMLKDEIVTKIMTPAEVERYVQAHFISQGSGKRKLANMKVRMIIDRLQSLAAKARELGLLAQKRFQTEEG